MAQLLATRQVEVIRVPDYKEELTVTTSVYGQPEHLIAYNTYQVKNYDRYELAGFSEETKRQWRDEHWEEDLQKAFEAGAHCFLVCHSS